MVEALAGDCARCLSDGGEPEVLGDALRRLPKLESADLAVTLTDLNVDGLSDVVVEPRFIGLAVLGCLASRDGAYTCQPLPAPAAFGDNVLAMQSDVLSQDLIGDGRPETVVTYTLQGGSGWTELLYVFRWPQPAWSEQVFRATLRRLLINPLHAGAIGKRPPLPAGGGRALGAPHRARAGCGAAGGGRRDESGDRAGSGEFADGIGEG